MLTDASGKEQWKARGARMAGEDRLAARESGRRAAMITARTGRRRIYVRAEEVRKENEGEGHASIRFRSGWRAWAAMYLQLRHNRKGTFPCRPCANRRALAACVCAGLPPRDVGHCCRATSSPPVARGVLCSLCSASTVAPSPPPSLDCGPVAGARAFRPRRQRHQSHHSRAG